MNYLKNILVVCIVAILMSCGQAKTKISIIDENIAVAEQHLTYLLAQSEADGTLRIPATYENGKIKYVPTYDWVSGFFAGTLWYMYELTNDEKWASAAQRHTEHLESAQHLKWHHDIGFMIYDSYGNGLRLKNIDGYKDVIVTAANSLTTRFREVPGIIQSWNTDKGWQSERGWECPVIIDNMMNLELLFKATEFTGDSTYYNLAVKHADRTIEEHFRPDYSSFHVVDYSVGGQGDVRGRYTAQGYSDESAWARGQAWAVYGYLVCYRETGDEKYLNLAKNIAKFIIEDENMPVDLVPYWDYDAPNIPNEPRDASSAAIVASALYEMYTYTQNEEYKATADKMIESLSTPAYRAPIGENGGFILMHSVGSIPHNSKIDVPLNYADYYFLEALVRKGKIESGKKLF